MDFSDGLFTITLAPEAPSNLQLTVISPNWINLDWQDNSSDETLFRIERKTGPTGKWEFVATVGPNVTIFQNKGLTKGTTYYYRVRAYNVHGKSVYSNEAFATTPLAGPAAPTNLKAAAASATSIKLTWKDNASNETGFRIERKTIPPDKWEEVATVGANVATYVDSGLTTGTTYYYRVYSYNAAADSNTSNEASATPPAKPAAPVGTDRNERVRHPDRPELER